VYPSVFTLNFKKRRWKCSTLYTRLLHQRLVPLQMVLLVSLSNPFLPASQRVNGFLLAITTRRSDSLFFLLTHRYIQLPLKKSSLLVKNQSGQPVLQRTSQQGLVFTAEPGQFKYALEGSYLSRYPLPTIEGSTSFS
jgi:hypothetical protein